MSFQAANIGLLVFGDTGWGDELLAGCLVTLELAACALLVGLILGLVLAGAKLSRSLLLRGVGEVYTAFIRATPEFLILLLFYYGIEQAVQSALDVVGVSARFEMPRFLAAVIGLAMKVLYFDPWLLIGIALDAMVLTTAVAGWPVTLP